tara:strand:- start:1559 stop:3955 length:2397 start_codon:yes stop_codon:yes gene_type:complete
MASNKIVLEYTAELKGLKKQLSEVGKLSEGEARKAVQALNKSFRAANAAQRKAAKAATTASKTAAKSAKSASKQTISLTMDITKLATLAKAASMAIFNLAQEVADLRNDLIDASTRTGIAADTLGGLRLAAEGSGQAFESLLPSLDQLPKRMADAASGVGPIAEAFADLEVKADDGFGALRPADDVLKDLLAALGNVTDGTTRAALASQVFGKSGGKLLQALGNTSSLEAFVGMAEEFGVSSGPEAAAASGEWQRAVAELNTVLDGLKARLVGGDGLTAAVQTFSTTALMAFDGLSGAVDGYMEQLGRFTKAWTDLATLEGLPDRADDLFLFNVPLEAAASGIVGVATAGTKAAESLESYRAKIAEATSGTDAQAAAADALRIQFENEAKAAADAKAATAAATKARKAATASAKRQREAASEALKVVAQLAKEEKQAAQAAADAASLAADIQAEALEAVAAQAEATRSMLAGLSAEVDALIPPAALSRVDELALLLMSLDSEAGRSDTAAKALAEDIGRVGDALAEAQAEAAGGGGFAAMFEAAQESAAGILDKVGGVTDALSAVTGGALDLSVGGVLEAAGGGKEGAEEMVDASLSFIDGLVKGLPSFLRALIDGIPSIIHGLIGALPELIQALIAKLPVLAIELATSVIASLINNLPALIKALAKGIGLAIWNGLKSLFRFFADFFKEIRTLGRAKTRTFGDTPGVLTVPPTGLTASFAPGDRVVAARSEQGLINQLGAPRALDRPPVNAGPSAVRLDIADGHVGLDRLFRRNMQNGGALAPRARTGRVAVFNRGG